MAETKDTLWIGAFSRKKLEWSERVLRSGFISLLENLTQRFELFLMRSRYLLTAAAAWFLV